MTKQTSFLMPAQPRRLTRIGDEDYSRIVFLRQSGLGVYRQGGDLIVDGTAMDLKQLELLAAAKGWRPDWRQRRLAGAEEKAKAQRVPRLTDNGKNILQADLFLPQQKNP